MKQLFRHTTSLLRTALLLGAMILVNTQTQAQTVEQLAKMPSAFETIEDVTSIIGDGHFYYIQFYDGSDISYLVEHGDGNNLRTKDYIPFATNRQWTLESAGGSRFYLKSARGIYARLDGTNYKGTNSQANATALTYLKRTNSQAGGGYEILVSGSTNSMDRQDRAVWADVIDFDNNSNRYPGCRLRIVKLKDNVAHIIYWQEPIYKNGSVVDRNTDTRGGEPGFTQHHYLTNSGTNDNQSAVSSRKSILWYYDAWQLPTAAAYHQDGLWTLESAGPNGEFYIKKYGEEEYLNYDGNSKSVLGTKDADYGKYTLENANTTNRYVRIQNGNMFVADDLTTSMFHWWNGWGANASQTSQVVPTLTYNVGNDVEVSTSNATVIGDDWHVRYLLYADLTGYSKIVFEGTPGLELRVLMNRDQPNGSDEDGGPLLDWHCTIGDNGKGELSLSELAFAHLNSIKVYGGSGKISSIKLMKPNFVASSLSSSGSFYTWNGDGADATTTGDATVAFNVGNTVNASETIAGDGNVNYLTYANLTGSKKIIFEGTPGVQLRVLMNRQGDGGPLTEKTATISNFGKAEVDISDLPYVHLNAIKAGWSSPEGVITAIKVMTPALGGSNLFLSCANTDGNPVTQATGNTSSDWYAGFLPVEVPVPNKDEYYQVVMGIRDGNSRLKLTGAKNNPQIDPYPESTLENLYSAKFTPNQALTNVFQHQNLNVADYDKLVIEFGEPVPGTGAWNVNGIIGGNNGFEALPTGATRYEMDLTGINTITDLTIFNMNYPADPIVIKGIYLTPEKPVTQMTNYEGWADTYSEEPSLRKLWQLEQVDDFRTFRVKDNKGEYLKGLGEVTAPNDPTEAEVYTNQILLNKFQLKWFYVNPVDKEIPVNHWVTHRESYLKQYSIAHSDLDLAAQGLATKAQSDWWVYGKEIQKVNHFEITHYVKKNNTVEVEFPTILNNSNDHIYYQRFYHYNDESCDNTLYPDGTDIEGLKAHVSLDTRDQGDVQYFLYKNGMVTGAKLDWTDIEQGGYKRNEQRKFNFTNSDGKPFTVAVDVSRYSDMTYQNAAAPLEDDLEEPTLTMRYIYMMKDAKDMAARLTACTQGSNNWLEKKDFHFPAKQIFYENQKKAGYRGEFIGLRHVFSDYWVFDGNGTEDENLVSAVNDKSSGKIEVEIVDDATNPTRIRKGGWNPNIDRYGFADGNDADYQGFYFYDMMDFNNVTDAKASYGDSRFIVFRYPASGMVEVPDDPNVKQEAKINVYLNYNGTKYQLAQFTIIFDKGTVTLPYKQINNSSPYVLSDDFKSRDPKALVDKAGPPIAKITFDYPTGDKYHFPGKGTSKQGWWEAPAGATIDNCSPIPLTFGKTNYSFMGFECNWGSYSIVTQMTTNYGNHQNASPANDNTYGYGDANYPALQADQGLQNGFLYIDASEQPGDICSAPFVGDFCAGDKLMFSGWISGANKAGGGDNRCPGGITLTVKGEDADGNTKTLYRFCPGQIYELDNGPGTPDGSGVDGEQWLKNAQGQYIDGKGTVVDEANRVPNPNYDNNKYNVVWQQFYFVFTVSEKYERHWIEVNNNCVSSKGGDFMLDNVEVYCIVPEVKAEMNTPVCVHKDGSVDMSLLKLTVDFNKLVSSSGVNANTTANLGFVFLDKKVMLKTLIEKGKYSGTPENLAYEIEEGRFILDGNDDDYKAAFDAALLREPGNENIWKSTDQTANKGAGVMIFQWNSNFNEIEQYSFYKATSANKKPVYRYTDDDGERFLVMNGNFAELPWKLNTDYYIIPANIPDPEHFTFNSAYTTFNICSECSKEDVFQIQPPYTILGLDKSKDTGDYVVCEGQVPTLLTDLKGFDLNGNEVPMKDLNYDWWLGNSTTLATLENYHTRNNGSDVRLDKALSTLRIYYPDATDLDGIISHLAEDPNPELTTDMVQFLKELVDQGELVLHQKSISVPATPVSADDPYFYLVACPIHDAQFDQALNPQGNEYVAFFCDEPQGLRIKVGEKAPRLNTGFVAQENGFASYNYTGAGDAVLSIRLAKKQQFETVKHGSATDYGTAIHTPANTSATDTHFLWLPIRNAWVQSAESEKVIQKTDDENIYLASTNDPVWDKAIYTSMNRYDATTHEHTGSLPVVGKIVQLNAIDIAKAANRGKLENDYNRLCVYFTENFEVREGYSYTLSLPFKESPGENTCDGTILINLKIVPDYEVWTGGAGNTDWNNDENWRRADGNLSTPTAESTDGSKRNNNELLRTGDLPATSLLSDYVTNYSNYRTAKDRILRKGFAPLYCTHVLIKSNEWGDAPVLYDALDTESGKTTLAASPFPNLRDTSTPILKYDMQARLYDIWADTYGAAPNKGRSGDLIAEMYQVNSCDEIAFQHGAEMLNAHLLNYNSAWMEYQLDMNRWYLLGSPLQGTIAGEWYAPTGTAQQKTTYYEPVTFGQGYDRYSPAIYQRSWDKAKAVLYEIGADYATADDDQTQNLGTPLQGAWSNATWDVTNADRYLDRLGYKPMSGNKANVAMKGIWSNTYNDATVDYTQGGFSVMVKNDLKGGSNANPAIIRLPKEDTMYDYYKFDENGSDNGGTYTELSTVQSSKNRAKNRGRLKSDLLLPVVDGSVVQHTYQQIQRTEASASRYGDQRTYTRVPTQVGEHALPMTLRPFTESVSAGISNLGYYLVENPFACGLDMNRFFEENTGLLKKYWIIVSGANGQPQQQLVQQAESGDWFTQNGTTFTAAQAKVAPGQGFFVEAATVGDGSPVNITFNSAMQAQTRYGEPDAGEEFTIVVGTKQKMETIPATYDDDGDPSTPEVALMIDDPANPGQQVQATIEVPKKNKQTGEYEVEDITDKITVYKYKQQTGDGRQFPLLARTLTRGSEAMSAPGMVITAERGGRQSCALVMQRDEASDEFMPQEDTELFTTDDQRQVPAVYTLCGRLATTVNSIREFRTLPLGVESASDAPCLLTFRDVEELGDSVALYDAVEKKLTPLESGMTVSVSGQTQNRYYLVRSLSMEDAAEETHLQIFTEGLTAKVIASTAEPITDVRCFDTAGRLIHSANPQTTEYSFSLPAKGIYIIEAQTDNDRKTVKLMAK